MTTKPKHKGESKMKKLTDTDLAFLKSRGKVVNGFTTIKNNEPIKFDAPKKVKKSKAKKTVKKHPLVGRMLHTSFGYNMTINDFAKIIEVSPTGKTCVCRKLNKVGFNGFTGTAKAGEDMHGPKFRLKIKGYTDWTSFVGSYPYCGDRSKRFGYFSLYNGEEVYENHMD
jgi:hypothetical protein